MKKALLVAIVLGMAVCLVLPMGTVMAGAPPVYEPQYYLAAHVVVVPANWDGITPGETAWADCNNSQVFPGSRWAWYFSYPGNPGGGAPGYDNAWELYAGKKTGIGWVGVAITGNDMAVTFFAVGNWRFEETHLAVVSASEGWEAIPMNAKGSPIPGAFTGLDGEKTGMHFDPPVQAYTYHFTISP